MKVLISFLVGIITFLSLIFFVDGALVNYIMAQLPVSAHEWFGIIKLVVWFVVISFTAGFATVISYIVGAIVLLFLVD